MRMRQPLMVLALALGAASAAEAQSAGATAAFPARPIRFIVPNAAGGSTDLVARTVAHKAGEGLGQQIVIDNRPGSGGIIGTELVAKAQADGHTLLMGTIGNLAISPHLYRKLAYDPIKDFAPVTQLASAAYMLVIHPSVPAKSVKELVALARSRPSQLNYASAGSGTGSHLSAELFRSVAGIALVHVPYKGGTPAITDVIGGQVQIMLNGIPSSLPHLKTGRIRALAVTTTTRSPAAPELPTMAEAGYPGAESTSWTGVLAPAGTPAGVIARLNADFVQALRTPEVSARLSADGAVPVGSSAAEFAAYLRSELVKWGKVVRASGATVN
ncbi:MAG: tripartite tricarboxylate transporter substrate binding protein [Betaproteobacteria bacterium]|nr:tripartite tricarboxylate transporter substrate binding protein [Betaproteobacteria bacterium]